MLRRCAGGIVAIASSGVVASAAFALPPNFSDELVMAGWDEAVGVAFGYDGRAFVWEKGGRVWLVEDGVKSAAPLIDIAEEVGNWRDFGLLGFAVDPNFASNGFVYLVYAVDYHHLAHFGTPAYNSNMDEYFHDTIARVTRYTCNAGDDFHSVDYGSRLVLIGESMTTGIPLLHQSHGIGTLVFGEDGTLIVGAGDGASYQTTDTGGPMSGSSNTGLADGIITSKENVGAYRAQLIDSHNGKMLRIDPATGDGVASNPYYDAGAPRAPRSRVWALGFRNPFRLTLRPGTGAADPASADPGTLYIGDVGYNTWEELDVCTTGGQNFGWPKYEGHTTQSSYNGRGTENQDAPNPLACDDFFAFRDLIVQDTLATPSWPNPCDSGQQVPGSIPKWMHSRPAIDWFHSTNGPARLPTFSGTSATTCDLGSGGCMSGAGFGGNSSTGGAWYGGVAFPPEYQNTYFHADYIARWIRNFVFDANDQLVEVRAFQSPLGYVVDIEFNPFDGALYYINYNDMGAASLRRIVYRYPPCPCEGDVDCDGDVDLADLNVLLFNFGAGVPANTAGDLDGNGVVELADLQGLLFAYGQPCP
ncbi:MAG: PQQ-dependent sugar dehydrogenase [Phycisphaerales bacterium]|nr:PQQ-dependent sugar dehydrogenase [Phycisphaerales bacterium]